LLNEPALVAPTGFFKGRDATIVTAGVLEDAFVLSLATRVLEMPVSAYAKPSAQVDDPASSNADVSRWRYVKFKKRGKYSNFFESSDCE
jgi:hypothetical protein